MNITIHRGTDQIGGCVTEYEYKGWRLFVDYGEQLPGAPKTTLKVEGLTHGDVSKSALLITHYHGDHVGCIVDLPEELPIFMGAVAKEILEGLSTHIGCVDEKYKALNTRLKTVRTFSPGLQFGWGEFQIMPIIMDHSAFDAYAFCIEARGMEVFHTGDFRTHGFRSGTLPKVIENYIGRVDYVVCEATNVNKENNKSEYELQNEFKQSFVENKYNVVYVSSTNIDRLFALYHAALRADRPFYVDSYQKNLMDIVTKRDKIWGKSRLYKYVEGREPIVLHRVGDNFRTNEKFLDYLSEKGYVIIARSNSKFDELLSKIPSDGRKVYLSMWKGYVDESKAAYNQALAQSMPSDYVYKHTSGHCDMESIESLLEMLRPRAVIPIHTDEPKKFAELFSDKWPILLMHDGDTFRPVKSPDWEQFQAKFFAKQKLDDDIQIVANPEGMEVWSLDDRFLGEFRHEDEALWALTHSVYAPDRLIGYGIENDEDMEPWSYKVYDKNLNFLSSYEIGGHCPKGENRLESSAFSPGDKVYALCYAGLNVIFPCELVGPITEKFLRKQFKEDEFAPDTFKEFIEGYRDWAWDSVIVKSFVQLKRGMSKIKEYDSVNRIYLFPYDED